MNRTNTSDDHGDPPANEPLPPAVDTEKDDNTISPSDSNSPRDSPKGSNASLSDPFQDTDFLSETVPSRLHRRSASVPSLRRLALVNEIIGEQLTESGGETHTTGPQDQTSSSETYFQRLMAELKLKASSPIIVFDNAVLHSSSWNETALMPQLDEYHPLDDYMVYLLRRERIHARNVILISDNPKTHMLDGSFRSLMTVKHVFDATESSDTAKPDEDQSESSLNVEGLAEYFSSSTHNEAAVASRQSLSLSPGYRRIRSIARLPSIQKRLTSKDFKLTSPPSLSSADDAGTQDASFPRESYESQDISQLMLSPMKEESPSSVMDVLGIAGPGTTSSNTTDKKKTVRNIDTETLGLKTEENL